MRFLKWIMIVVIGLVLIDISNTKESSSTIKTNVKNLKSKSISSGATEATMTTKAKNSSNNKGLASSQAMSSIQMEMQAKLEKERLNYEVDRANALAEMIF